MVRATYEAKMSPADVINTIMDHLLLQCLVHLVEE